jgi:hypothetical protein
MKHKVFLGGASALLALMVLAAGVTRHMAQEESQPNSAAEGRMETALSTIQPNGPEAFSNVPPLSTQQHQQLVEKLHEMRQLLAAKKGAVPPGPGPVIPVTSTPETQLAAGRDLVIGAVPAPGALYIGLNKQYTVVGDGQSTVAEPSIANSGSLWFATQNWSRGYSNNAGVTWTGIADDSGPADAPHFCCDQDAVHDHIRDVSFWEELFINSALTTGVVRIHVRNLNNLSDTCSYDVNGGAGIVYDYPKLGLGKNYIYLTTNTIGNSGSKWNGATVWRYNLDQMSKCQPLSGNVFNWTGSVGQVVWVPARGTNDTMYLVTIENANTNRYFSWPENSNTITWKTIGVASSNFGAATCKGGTSNSNWMGDPLETSSIGFQVRSALGQDNGTEYLATYYTVADHGPNRPQAYAAGAIVRTSDMTFLNNADIFNASVCIGMPDVTANAHGDLGLSIAGGSSKAGGGGGATAVQGYIGISDDYSRSGLRGFFQSFLLTASGNDNPSRFGDYYTARVEEGADLAFIAANYGDNAGVPNTWISEFLRGRYYLGWLHHR